MNQPEASPSFHDAHQGTSPGHESGNTPASAVDTTPTGIAAIWRRRLFPEPGNLDRDNDDDNEDEDDDDDNNNNLGSCIRRLKNQAEELDMNQVTEEQNENGDGDSNCSASEIEQLISSVEESTRERREVVVLEDDNEIICETGNNMIEIKRGLGIEVKVSEPPVDWVPDRIKTEMFKPESFEEIDNPGEWGPYTFRAKFHNKAKGKDIKRNQYSHHALPTGARPCSTRCRR